VFADNREAVLDELVGRQPDHGDPRNDTGVIADPPPPRGEGRTFNLREIRRRTVREALEATHGHLTNAAKLLGVCPNTMTKLVAEACPERSAARPSRARRPR
jgi:DNA-binding NtrC family response regulator